MFNFPMLMLNGVWTPPPAPGSGFILGYSGSYGHYTLELDFSSGTYSHSTRAAKGGEMSQTLAHRGRGVCDKAGGAGYVMGGHNEPRNFNTIKKFTKSSSSVSILSGLSLAGFMRKAPLESDVAGYSGFGRPYYSGNTTSAFLKIVFSSDATSSLSSGLDTSDKKLTSTNGFSSSSDGFLACRGDSPSYFRKMSFSSDSFSVSSSLIDSVRNIVNCAALFDKALGKAVLKTTYSSGFYAAGTFNMSSETYGAVTTLAFANTFTAERCGAVRDAVSNAGVFVNDGGNNSRRYSFGSDTFSDETGYSGTLPEPTVPPYYASGTSCGID